MHSPLRGTLEEEIMYGYLDRIYLWNQLDKRSLTLLLIIYIT